MRAKGLESNPGMTGVEWSRSRTGCGRGRVVVFGSKELWFKFPVVWESKEFEMSGI